MDRRTTGERRKSGERRKADVPVAVERRTLERRAKVSRRRQIDPTTCERDYSPDEVEFMNAMDQYKRSSGRMFPTCSEILEVLSKLGYVKQAVETPPSGTETALPPDLSELSTSPPVAPSATVEEVSLPTGAVGT